MCWWIVVTWPQEWNAQKNFDKQEIIGTLEYCKQILKVTIFCFLWYGREKIWSLQLVWCRKQHSITFPWGCRWLPVKKKKKKSLARIFCLSFFWWNWFLILLNTLVSISRTSSFLLIVRSLFSLSSESLFKLSVLFLYIPRILTSRCSWIFVFSNSIG